MFTDYYGEQSCTAGRSSFIMGQSVFRTGLSKVGLPGADLGMREEEPTIAALLKARGYATGQFGKNHLGDKDEHLPTNHGFDEFFGNLYHLNAEEEPVALFEKMRNGEFKEGECVLRAKIDMASSNQNYDFNIYKTMSWKQASEAHAILEGNENSGKVVLLVE